MAPVACHADKRVCSDYLWFDDCSRRSMLSFAAAASIFGLYMVVIAEVTAFGILISGSQFPLGTKIVHPSSQNKSLRTRNR